MPMIGARFYTQLDSAQLRNDILENELAKVNFKKKTNNTVAFKIYLVIPNPVLE